MSNNPQTKINRDVFNKYEYGIKNSRGILTKFPTTLGNEEHENQPAMLFKFHSPIPDQGEPDHPSLSGENRYIGLPIPKDLPFAESYTFNDDKSITDYWTALNSALRRGAQNVKGGAGGGVNRLDRNEARITNNRAAVLFNTPKFRDFKFTWDLIPRNKTEARLIQSIVQRFRICAASEFEKGNEWDTYLKYPNLVSFLFQISENKIFPASYACFIETVGYKPIESNGQILFFDDGMAGFTLSIDLKETMYLDRTEISDSIDIQGF